MTVTTHIGTYSTKNALLFQGQKIRIPNLENPAYEHLST